MENPLFVKSDLLAKKIYSVCRYFPRDEIYGLTSQLRRSALSVVLNIIEGFARRSSNEFRRFLIISYGSLKETKYLLLFSLEQQYLNQSQYQEIFQLSEEVAKLLWTVINKQ